jgi:ribosomal protein S18 acetylase RimI-like enzyme
MVLYPLPANRGDTGERRILQIKQVASQDDLGDFWKAAGRAFNMPRLALRMVLPDVPPDSAGPEGAILRLFVGYEEGRPVATSALVVSEKIAGIFFVGVDPSARRRGHGRAVTEAAIESGRADGCDASYLAATKMGTPLYANMGYRKLTDYPEWTKQPSRLDLMRSYVWFTNSTLRQS